MLEDFEVPMAVALTTDELRDEVRKKQFFVCKFNHRADLLVDFSKPLSMKLYRTIVRVKVPGRINVPGRSYFACFGFSVQKVDAWCVEMRNGDRDEKIHYDAKGYSASAPALMRQIELAKTEYERALRALKQAEGSVTL